MIKEVSLINFRNFKKKSIEFSDKTTVIIGPNAAGKTNILETLSLLSTGKSFRAGVEGEMVSYNSEIARIVGKVISNKLEVTSLETVLTRGSVTIGETLERVPKKKLLVNGVAKRLIDFAGNFKTVLFGPWDMDIVSGSPSLRREFLDSVLSQVDREYLRSKLSYEKGLRQRNKILWDLRENPFIGSAGSPLGTTGRERLHFWDKLLIKNGNYISQKREEFISFANNTNEHQFQMNTNFKLEYDKSAISESRLEDYQKEEIASATTLVGPHRDDMKFQITNSKLQMKRNLATYGSRGEQRMGILWLKLNELNYIEKKTREEDPSASSGLSTRPTLLLDDIFSELDHEHRGVVMDIVGNQQTIITTADEHFVEGLPESSIIKLY